MDVTVFILTHKMINEDYDRNLYKPLLTGAVFKEQTFDYLTDDVGENISKLNKYYGELSGDYWVWKNDDSDIIGFCHYRRWYVKNIFLKKLTKDDILNDLKKYDIVLPYRLNFDKALYAFHEENNIKNPSYDVLYEDYIKVEEVLQKFFPDYAKTYNTVMNGKILWPYNMFICKRKLAEEYFEWLFNVLDILIEEFDLTKYDSKDTRVFAFISERLLTTFILKNKLSVKEYDVYLSERKIPISQFFSRKIHLFDKIETFISEFFKK